MQGYTQARFKKNGKLGKYTARGMMIRTKKKQRKIVTQVEKHDMALSQGRHWIITIYEGVDCTSGAGMFLEAS